MRARGLKLPGSTAGVYTSVAPHAGAWIETLLIQRFKNYHLVAPHAGAWIETPLAYTVNQSHSVAPHAGAWIETHSATAIAIATESRPMRARGLKPPVQRQTL